MEPQMQFPGLWRYPTDPENCCIHRVPNSIRSINPEAYTPQLVILGPLNHSLKSQALNSLGDITDTKSMGYVNMEEHKKIYLKEFTRRRRVGENTINIFRSVISKEEMRIRESYSESTAWIESSEFVKMILHDCVFIVEFILRTLQNQRKKIGDPLVDKLCVVATVNHDLILLENQLPYFILEELFGPIMPTLRELILKYFRLEGKIGSGTKFKHFTDLYRCVRVETLHLPKDFQIMGIMYNADKLHSRGVKFEAVEEEFPMYVRFENGCLKMPCLEVYDEAEMVLRNIMALEQCHYPYDTHVCNYVVFLDYLIDTEKDVDLLVEKGIIKNYIGEHRSVAEMVNKLGSGISPFHTYYPKIAVEINARYSNPYHRSYAILKRVYFGNLWTGTATVAAMLLLFLTLIQAVTSIYQVTQKAVDTP